MPSLKLQKLVPGSIPGLYLSGSASLVSNQYKAKASEKGHTAHTVIENLGRVIWLNENKRCGLFLSPTRGLVEYDADKDTFNEVAVDDPRLNGSSITPHLIPRTNFGDSFYCLSMMNKNGFSEVLRQTFPEDKTFERVLAHCMHTIIKNSARISCADFISHSVLSYGIQNITIGTLDKDSSFFEMMGSFETKLAFFKNYISHMRKTYPEFGKACYVDSTPLPNDTSNNPFNAFCSHGTGGPVQQTRLVLLLDILSGKPVWFEFIHGNKLDHTTLEEISAQLKIHIDINIEGCILDAGYACAPLFEKFNTQNHKVEDEDGHVIERTMITRMPDKNGYPYGDMYQATRELFMNAEYHIVRGEHTYFAYRFENRSILGYPENVYVYLDFQQALALNQQYRSTNPGEWDAYTPEEKNWLEVKDGFFCLISNKNDTAEKILDEYLERVKIEHLFKTPKEYLGLLPLKKWTIQRIKGKVLCDVITTICYLDIRKTSGSLGMTMPRLLVSLSSIECDLDMKNNMVVVTTPNRQLRHIFDESGIFVPGHITLDDLRAMVSKHKCIDTPSIQARPKTMGRPKKVHVPQSEEQKAEEKEQKKQEQEAQRIRKKKAKAAVKAATQVIHEANRAIEYVAVSRLKMAKKALEKAQTLLEEASQCEHSELSEESSTAIRQASQTVKKAKKLIDKAEKQSI